MAASWRLNLVTGNARLPVLGPVRVPNLASRAPGLSLRRLPGDMRDLRGHSVLLAETLVDRPRFGRGCYRAANWLPPGYTRGFSRIPGSMPRLRPNGQPKEVYVYDLGGKARLRLSGPAELAGLTPESGRPAPASRRCAACASFSRRWRTFARCGRRRRHPAKRDQMLWRIERIWANRTTVPT